MIGKLRYLRRHALLSLLSLLLPGLLVACDDASSPLVCEFEDQCLVFHRDGMFKHNLDDTKTWCECSETASGTCSGAGAEFHTGSCEGDTIAFCAFSEDREQHYYRGFGATVGTVTHSALEGLKAACTTGRDGTFTVIQPNLCTSDAVCDDGIACNGAEKCVVKEICTTVCSQAACESSEPICTGGQVCNPNTGACQ